MNYSQDLFWSNLRGTKGRIIKKLHFLESGLKEFLLKIDNPCFIWTGTGRIHQLENKILDQKILNKNKNYEFYFFLYEPMCIRIGDYNRSFYSEFDSTENIKDIVSDEIESIRIFVKNNNISNFRILAADYNIQLLQEAYPDVKLNCLDLFLRHLSRKYYDLNQKSNSISKKFWCGNWRYTAHRHLLASYLSSLDGTYSWNLKCSYTELEKNNWFDLSLFKEESPKQYQQLKNGIEFLYNNTLAIDQHTNAVEVDQFENVFIPNHSAPEWSTVLTNSYKDCFCAVVNETRFAQPFGNFSEKTLAAISSKLPFIIAAPPYTLEYLKTFGFKTFSKWWDESYDTETNHYRRMIKIFDVIDYINSKSIEELKLIYNEMEEILLHNRDILRTLSENDEIL